jgi:hypothetical protein
MEGMGFYILSVRLVIPFFGAFLGGCGAEFHPITVMDLVLRVARSGFAEGR